MLTAVVTVKGQIVIPSKIRRKLSIKKGTKLCIEENSGELVLKPVTSEYFQKLSGILPTRGRLSRILLDERFKDKNRGK